MTLQQIIFSLKNFWAEQGCAVLEGWDQNIGAATLAPFTALYAMKKNPWNICQVQYCRRPTDARFGENPNRLGGYYQMQVILKPIPKDPQALYVQSLAAIGIDPVKNDIRFIEDNWENPSIGASGLGFEVWVNGMECSQWTYMKQIGGVQLKEVPLEITYGLERIAMYVQNVDNIFDLRWNESLKYGDIFKEREIEMSHFYKNEADTAVLFQRFNEFEESARRLTSKNLLEPAYEECLSASNILNILDARKTLSQSERTNYILRVRTLVKAICERISEKL